MGMLADKDSRNSLRLLEGLFDEIYTVPVNNPRAMTSAQLTRECSRYFDSVKTFESAEHAFDIAFNKAKNDDYTILIFGSLYLAGEIRPYILNKVAE